MVSIPEYVKKHIDEMLVENKNDNSKTIFIMGSKSAGKSTLINLFLEKNDTPRESSVLEYSFGRKLKQKQGLEKSICHIWEYGGRLALLKEVLAHIPKHGAATYIVVVDLSDIKNVWNTLDPCLEAVTDTNAKTKADEDTSNLIIVGAKYDLFNNYDSEIKKLMCSTLRSVALQYGAHLVYYTSKEPSLVRRMKEFLHFYGFGSGSLPKDRSTNPNKPLLILKSCDSWESIGISAPSSINQVKTRYVSAIPQELSVGVEGRGRRAGGGAHAEPQLDALVAAKYEELRYLDGLEMAVDDYLHSLRSQ